MTEYPGIELMEQFVQHSPFAKLTGMEARSLKPDQVELALPFREEIVTMGDTVHGGAISTLIDMAGTVAAWTGLTELPETPVGSTVALSVNFLRAARSKEIVATARIVKRGRSMCFAEVSVTETDGELVANGLVTYKLG